MPIRDEYTRKYADNASQREWRDFSLVALKEVISP